MRRRASIVCILVVGSMTCGKGGPSHQAEAGKTWPVTAWGSTYEVFAEIDPLVAGSPASSNTHVTLLKDFSPLRDGSVALLLSDAGSLPLVFEQKQRKRDGIYVIDVKPPREGTFAMSFRIEGPSGREEIPAGRVRVGGPASPGGLVSERAAQPESQTISFLKEQQWRTEFAMAPVSEGALRESVGGPARVRAAAGGEVTLTAPVDAVVARSPWPYIGQDLQRGTVVLGLTPRVATDRSLSELQAQVAALDAEQKALKGRVERLDQLLKVEAVSAAEVERTRASLAGLDARLEAARQDLEAASAARLGGQGAPTLFLRAPWAGRVAEVSSSPGQAVAAGAPLARIVQERPVWVDIALRPEDATRLAGEKATGLILRRAEVGDPVSIPADQVRLISRSPEVDTKTSSIGVLLEVDRSVSEIPLGTAAEAELLLSGERRGVLVPVSALVDDSGVTVAYEQLSGETFARREVRVLQRQGPQAIVEGLRPGARIAARGGAAIRRASLLSAGAPEGHVH